MFKNMIKLDNIEIFIPFVMILILPFIWFISISRRDNRSNQKNPNNTKTKG